MLSVLLSSFGVAGMIHVSRPGRHISSVIHGRHTDLYMVATRGRGDGRARCLDG